MSSSRHKPSTSQPLKLPKAPSAPNPSKGPKGFAVVPKMLSIKPMKCFPGPRAAPLVGSSDIGVLSCVKDAQRRPSTAVHSDDPLLRHQPFVDVVVGHGWADRERLEAILTEIRAWAERPDAFYSVTYCAALGWVGAEQP